MEAEEAIIAGFIHIPPAPCDNDNQESEEEERSRFRRRKNVAIHLDKVKGRLNVAVLTKERIAIAKFDGWPEVSSSRKSDVITSLLNHMTL